MDKFALILVIIGALNWGLIALFQFDLVASIFGGQTAIFSRIVYGLVGLAGLYCITLLFSEYEKTESTAFTCKSHLYVLPPEQHPAVFLLIL